MHTVRIGINEDYFSKDFHAFIPTKKKMLKLKQIQEIILFIDYKNLMLEFIID